MQIYKKYAVYAVIVIVAVAALGFILSVFFNFNSSSGTSIVVLLIPAINIGRYFYKAHGRTAKALEKLKFSAVFTLIQLVINGMIAGAIVVIFPELISFLSQINAGVLAIVLVVVFIISVLVSYLGFSLGVYSARKAAEKQAIKNG